MLFVFHLPHASLETPPHHKQQRNKQKIHKVTTKEGPIKLTLRRRSLIFKGIDPDEAKARIDCLSDSEAIAVADKIKQLPAGGGAIGALIGAALIVFLVLLVTDILGYTDVFPFVKSQKK